MHLDFERQGSAADSHWHLSSASVSGDVLHLTFRTASAGYLDLLLLYAFNSPSVEGKLLFVA